MENGPTTRSQAELTMWVIYKHPRDYPQQYVARLWEIRAGCVLPTADVMMADTLAEIRKSIPVGLFRTERFSDDDPCIVEVWI